MIKSNTAIDSEVTRKILKIYLGIPAESLNFKELRDLLPKLSETPIRNALRTLKLFKILEVSHERGRPRGGFREKYRISNDLDAFEKLSEMYRINGIDEFIKSEYINSVKKKYTPISKKEARCFGFKSIIDFIELDIHLSPITAIPAKFSPGLLLNPPFERIFSDVYILNKDDIRKLIKRAHIFYSNFPEIFSSAVKYTITERSDNRDHMKDIDSLVRQAIFYWNIASYNFDWVYDCLIDAIQSKDEIEFYIEFAEGAIVINKLKNIHEYIYFAEDNLVNNYFLSEPIQFDSLRPCNCFRKFESSNEAMTYERIVSEVKSHFQADNSV
jgi:hypothetical protein